MLKDSPLPFLPSSREREPTRNGERLPDEFNSLTEAPGKVTELHDEYGSRESFYDRGELRSSRINRAAVSGIWPWPCRFDDWREEAEGI